MRTCTRTFRCYAGNFPQEDEEFIGPEGKVYNTCRSCRDKIKMYKDGYRAPKREKVLGPRFSEEWERQRHEEWLQGLITEVIRA